MTHLRAKPLTILAALCGGLLLHACGGGDDDGNDVAPSGPPVKIVVSGPNAVSYCNEVATATVNLPASATGTPEEQRPNTAVDLATVHVAIYDAVMAITGTHQPYAITPTTTASGASQEAAVAAAAYHVLRGLFPNRSAQYQSAYDAFVASMPADTAQAP